MYVCLYRLPKCSTTDLRVALFVRRVHLLIIIRARGLREPGEPEAHAAHARAHARARRGRTPPPLASRAAAVRVRGKRGAAVAAEFILPAAF